MPDLVDVALDLCACRRSARADVVAAALCACPGVADAHVDAYVTWALATFDPARTSADAIVARLGAAGLDVHVTRLFRTPPSPTSQEPA